MANETFDQTMMFLAKAEDELATSDILRTVYEALKEKGYNPINQLVGYLLSGDPAYITSHKNARSLIRRLERDDLLEELVRFYLESHDEEKAQ
ncbi:conserved hypothetical protein [Heliomicrobium modesticaldum Ice1]|uniref:UPF0297 protein HM1_0531 n=1 Tax=Heliobacterium modesticaldum (strain ATCC 51547 / Ice1) TaxID=498761 RepID=B0TFY8_HELMI|nr:IreB family regulatory phosphoprotein [Heliomicrobium modesticaldum]ABZ83145.1 conserved hypothetical protein [Heliomicrobium modesticaldum Ice1]